MQTTLDRAAEIARQKTEARKAAFMKLVTSLADGSEIDAEEIVRICEEAGRDLAQLQAAVDRLKRRREAAELLSRLPRFQAAEREAATVVAEVERERAAMLEEIDKRLRAARAKHRGAAEDRQHADRARDVLLSTADPALRERRVSLLRAIEGCESFLATAGRRSRELTAVASGDSVPALPTPSVLTEWASMPENWSDRQREDYFAECRAKAQRQLDKLRAEVTRAESDIATYRTELDSLTQEALQP